MDALEVKFPNHYVTNVEENTEDAKPPPNKKATNQKATSQSATKNGMQAREAHRSFKFVVLRYRWMLFNGPSYSKYV